MRYALLIVDSETAHPSPEPSSPEVVEQVMKAYNDYTQMLKDRGAYLGGEALEPNPTATTVRVQDGKPIVTDGPFVESKEALGGFYIVECASLDEALDWAVRLPDARHGGVEVRPVLDVEALQAEGATQAS